jgi:hypothetical protein
MPSGDGCSPVSGRQKPSEESRFDQQKRSRRNTISWALNSFGVPLDDFLPGAKK